MSRMRLKDIAIEKNERVDNPSQSQYSIFVGLEHYDSGEATIRRHGSTERLESTMKVFHSGDILIARRNVYLKRAATVDFDGLTSGDSIVLHIENEAYRRIAPFVLNTNDFWIYANQHADGSMSKRLSPKLLMEYEFSLPGGNLEQVADILWAMERVKTAYRELIARTDDLVKSQFIEMFGDPVDNTKSLPVCQLSEHIRFLTSGSRGWAKYHADDGEWFITIKNVKDCKISLDDVQCIVAPHNAEAERTRLREGDLLISITADLGRTGVVTKEIADHGAYINQHLTCIRLDRDVLNPLYVAFFMESDAGKKQFFEKNLSSVKAGLNFDSIRTLRLLVPPLADQERFIAFVEQSDKSKFAAQQALKEVTDAQKALMKKIFE